MSDYEVTGSTLLNWLNLVEPEFASTIIVGCGLDDGESDKLLPIISLDMDINSLNCSIDGETKRFPIGALRSLSIVDQRPNAPLREAINCATTPAEQELDSARDFLKSKGIKAHKIVNSDDVLELVQTVDNHDAGVLPSLAVMRYRYEMLKRTQLYHQGVKFTKGWQDLSERNKGPKVPEIYVMLAFFLRHSGRLDEAIIVTEVINFPRSKFRANPSAIAVLATQRAAILIDLYEIRRDLALLEQARKYAAKAWAIQQGDEVHMVYARLKKHENTLQDEKARLQKEEALHKIGNLEKPKVNKK